VRARTDSLSYRLARSVALPVRGESSATGHFNLGVALAALASGNDDPAELLRQAEEQLREAAELNPDHLLPRVELGKVLARQGRNGEAIDVYRGAETIQPRDYRIPYALGLLHRREGETAAAESAFRRALSLAPGHVASANRLGQILLEQGRALEAAEAFRHALRLAPGNRTAAEGLRSAEAASTTGR
jgi:Flp pilus assembly protein TadD